jgi:hypothetical protein
MYLYKNQKLKIALADEHAFNCRKITFQAFWKNEK